jgi:hypothetical protein
MVLMILLFLPLFIVIKLLLCGLVGLSYFYTHYKNRQEDFLITSFAHDKYHIWQLYTARGDKHVGPLLKQNYVSDFLVILHFKIKGGKRLVLFRTQFTEQDWRCLQMLLRN